ncbi:MAG: glycoside hydrolase [Bacteroidota bacterium]
MKPAFCLFFFSLVLLTNSTIAQQFNPDLYQNMRWRMIGPFRAGRTVGATGVPGQPNVFYIGVNNGGVWRTSDYGRTWAPIFDDQPTGSIGALAVAPSNPDIIYVGSGEGLQRPDLSVGDGVFKSIDGGKTWKFMGLPDAQQIGAVLVDPRDPNRVYVAVLGHPYGANEQRGVFKSTDGGTTWQKILYKDENTGAIALAFDPSNPDILYADLWASRQGPWENGEWQGKTSGLFKSTDGGTNWRQLTNGLPGAEQGLGRIGFGIAASDPNRIYATVDAQKDGGVYRSDDAGESWHRMTTDGRVWGRGSDFAEIKVDPKNRDIVYVANTASYKSTDGAKTFIAFKGAPGGDDYHTIWINPENSQIMLFATDQGATITVNGGETWSSWYNQPTAQLYHVSTDNQFPYNVYSGQQESGSVGIASRGNDGEITFREWHPVGADEYAYVAPDPLNPNIIFGGKVSRYDRTTGQVQNVAPEAVRSGKYRFIRTMPLIFSPVDPHILLLASNVLFKTINDGQSWDIISPDLTREKPDVPANIGIFRTPALEKQPRRGVIYAVAPSYKDVNVIWAGTDDGLVHVTEDGGKAWTDVTPPAVTAWSKVAQIDAGRFDSKTAYVAVNRMRLDDMKPHVYRTHDGGKTWTETVKGLPDSGPVNAVREDPERRGLLYAGTERAVYVSFNDGDEWQPLRLNMPATSIRDLVVHNDDIVVGTHGRSFWILDNVTPLRQISGQISTSAAVLFKPQVAYRVRWSLNTDTPLPPEEPGGQNPPDGAMIDYYLGADVKEVQLEILDAAGKVVRSYSSSDAPEKINENSLPYPSYWFRQQQMLSAKKGMQWFLWDLHYAPPEGVRRSYSMAAIFHDTPLSPLGPWVQPGEYSVRLTAGGKSFTQLLTVKMDPRIVTPQDALTEQYDLSMICYQGFQTVNKARQEINGVRRQLQALLKAEPTAELKDLLNKFGRKVSAIDGTGWAEDVDVMYSAAYATNRNEETFAGLQNKLLYLMAVMQGADAKPTTQATAAVKDQQQSLKNVLGRWHELKSGSKDVSTLNDLLKKSNKPSLNVNEP